MIPLPKPIEDAIEELRELPGIGPRQATRLAFYLIGKGSQEIDRLARTIERLGKIRVCERCFFPTLPVGIPTPASRGVGIVNKNPGSLCDICSGSERDQRKIMILEKETDLISIENTKKFNGRYFIIGTMPKTGMLEDWQKLRLQNLKSFIGKTLGGQADEIILGFNPTSLGDFHASLITRELQPLAKKISRLGRGLPVGGEIEFADDETLGSALDRRD